MWWTLIVACTWIPVADLDLDGDGVPDTSDCDRRDPAVGGPKPWYRDVDGDGFGTTDPLVGGEENPRFECERPDGHAAVADDCDDGDASVHPDAREVCNGLDDDCDGRVDDVDDVFDAPTWYLDEDGDGVPGTASVVACAPPPGGYPRPAVFDCDDADPLRSPLVEDVCGNGLDEDCSGVADDGPGGLTWWPDLDGDGFALAGAAPFDRCELVPFATALDPAIAADCDDADPQSHPGAPELWYDGRNQDCVPKDDYDADADGWIPAVLPPGSVPYAGALPAGDCNDADPFRNPGRPEVCGDAIDNDCDGVVDDADTSTAAAPADPPGDPAWPRWFDADGDGAPSGTQAMRCAEQEPFWVAVGTPLDCDDTNGSVHPGAIEVPGDGIDQDCSGSDAVVCHRDDDGDAFGEPSSARIDVAGVCGAGEVFDGTDCDDADALVHPGQVEWCDEIDHDCDGEVDPGEARATLWTAGAPSDVTSSVDPAWGMPADAQRLALCDGVWEVGLALGPGQRLGSPDGAPVAALSLGARTLSLDGAEVDRVALIASASPDPVVATTGASALTRVVVEGLVRDLGVRADGPLSVRDLEMTGRGYDEAEPIQIGIALVGGHGDLAGLTLSALGVAVLVSDLSFAAVAEMSLVLEDATLLDNGVHVGLRADAGEARITRATLTHGSLQAIDLIGGPAAPLLRLEEVGIADGAGGLRATSAGVQIEGASFERLTDVALALHQVLGDVDAVDIVDSNGGIELLSGSIATLRDVRVLGNLGPRDALQAQGGVVFATDLRVEGSLDGAVLRADGSAVQLIRPRFLDNESGSSSPIVVGSGEVSLYHGEVLRQRSLAGSGAFELLAGEVTLVETRVEDNEGPLAGVASVGASSDLRLQTLDALQIRGNTSPDVRIEAGGRMNGIASVVPDPILVAFPADSEQAIGPLGPTPGGGPWFFQCDDVSCSVSDELSFCATAPGPGGAALWLAAAVLALRRRDGWHRAR